MEGGREGEKSLSIFPYEISHMCAYSQEQKS